MQAGVREEMTESDRTELPPCFRCSNCGYSSSTFKAVCPRCGIGEMSVFEGAKVGKIVDFVTVSFPPENLKHLGTYTSVLVRLENGCQIFGIISGESKDVKIGTPVVISSYDHDTKALFFETV